MVGLGGALGALARAGLAEAWPTSPASWPWPTFVANVVGAALLGWLAGRPGSFAPLLGPGFCGALTTFSALQVETLRLAGAGETELAAAYPAASLVLGVAVAALGRRLR